MKRCLIVIDMQNGVFSLKRPVYRKDALVENVLKTIRFARDHGISVVFSQHENDTFLRTGSDGHRIVDALSVREEDTVIRKPRPDIFAGTNLDETLRQRGISSLMITGVISNGCVRHACQSALEKGYSVTLVKDAHSTFYAGPEKVITRVNREMELAGASILTAEEL